jgi:hypothetical protein
LPFFKEDGGVFVTSPSSQKKLEGETGLEVSMLQGGRVSNVNTQDHTYDVLTDNGSLLRSVPLLQGYLNSKNGAGFNVLASVNTRCLVANTINGEDIILGFYAPMGIKESLTRGTEGQPIPEQASRQESYSGRSANRDEAMRLEDQEIRGPAENRVRVMSSGAIEIISVDGQLLTKYINNQNEHVIISVAEVIENILPAGRFVWLTDFENSAGRMEFELRSNLEEDPDIKVRMGQLEETDPDADKLLVVEVGESFKMTVNSDGEVQLDAKKVTIKSEGDVRVDCKTANVNAKSQVRIKGSRISLN